MKKIFLTIAALILLTARSFAFDPVEIHDDRSRAEFWISKNSDGEQILLTQEEISQINSRFQFNALKSYDDENVQFAVTSESAELRSEPNPDLEFKTLDPLEPIVVLEKNPEGTFYRIETKDLAGWINARAVSFTNRETWLKFLEPEKFLVVTSNKKIVNIGSSFQIEFRMGSKIPIQSFDAKSGKYIARMIFDVNQTLNEIPVRINDDDSIHLGYLDCTENNFIRQAIQCLGDNQLDSYEFTAAVYRTMGLELPRDYRQERALPIRMQFTNLSPAEKSTRISVARSGAIIFAPGHAMMFLGMNSNKPIVIQSLDAYFTFDEYGIRTKNSIDRVVISNLDFLNSKGASILQWSTSVGEIRK